jgi:hypothetical protein
VIIVRLAVLLALLMLAGGCGGDGDDDDDGPASSPSAQAAPPLPEADPGTGVIDVEDFNGYLAEARPSFATDALSTAEEFVHVDEGQAATTTVVENEGAEGGGDEASVQVTRDGLADDSVRAVRYDVVLEKADDGMWRVRSAKRLQRCHSNRGHQDFSPQLCT